MYLSAKRGHALARVRIDAGRLNAQSGQYCGIFGPIPDERFEVFHGFFDSSEVFGMFRTFLSASRFVRQRSTRRLMLSTSS
jgi:hypothetical protein